MRDLSVIERRIRNIMAAGTVVLAFGRDCNGELGSRSPLPTPSPPIADVPQQEAPESEPEVATYSAPVAVQALVEPLTADDMTPGDDDTISSNLAPLQPEPPSMSTIDLDAYV